MSVDTEQIENAVLAALQSSGLKDICPNIDLYHGEIHDFLDQLEQLPLAMPATYVHWSGSKFVDKANRAYIEHATFSVYHIAKDLRGRKESRGSVNDMIALTRETLIGKELSLDIMPFKPEALYPVKTSRKFNIWVFDIKTSFSL